MCSKVLSGLPGLYSPDADGTALVVTTTYVSGRCQISSRGRKRGGLRTPTLHDGTSPPTPLLCSVPLCAHGSLPRGLASVVPVGCSASSTQIFTGRSSGPQLS